MFRSCIISNCSSKRKDFKLFRFPKREIGLQKWLDCINCEELRNKRPEDLCKRYVCQKHFEKKFICVTNKSGMTRLHVDAYPSLFSDIEISSGTLKTMYVDHTADIVVSEHTYTRKKEHQDHTYFKPEFTKKYESTAIYSENKEKDENKENEHEVNKEHENEGSKEHENEENKEIENEEYRDTETLILEKSLAEEEEEDITSFENTDIVDYVRTWTDDMPLPSGYVNETPEKPIAKDAVITSIVPSTPKLKVRRHHGDTNKKIKKDQPKKVKKSLPNCTTPVIKSPRQLKLSHRTPSKLNMSKAKSGKKAKTPDGMNPWTREFMWMHEGEANKEHENEEHNENEEKAYNTSFENTDLANYVTTWTDAMPSTSGCVNEATVNPITKDAVITIVPSTPKKPHEAPKKVRKRRVDINRPSQKAQPKNVKNSSPNPTIPVIKSLGQLKHCHKTAKKVNLSKTRSFKKVTDRMDPLAKDIMWMLIRQCTRKGLSGEDKRAALSTLKQVQSVTESCIKFLSSP